MLTKVRFFLQLPTVKEFLKIIMIIKERYDLGRVNDAQIEQKYDSFTKQ